MRCGVTVRSIAPGLVLAATFFAAGLDLAFAAVLGLDLGFDFALAIRTLLNLDADLAEVRGTLLVAEGVRQIFERECPVDDRLDPGRLETSHHIDLMATRAHD